MTSKPKIAIVGPGNLGYSLAQLFERCGYCTKVGARASSHYAIPSEAVADADIVLLTVSDGAITDVCQQLRAHLKPGSIVAHCSGALSSDHLHPAREAGCYIASAHPLNTFPNFAAAQRIFSSTDHNTYLFCEGDRDALALLDPLFSHLGFNFVELKAAAKTHYHAACVIACNYLSALMETSLQTAEEAGLNRDGFQRALQPLIRSTLENIMDSGPIASLSGPIARGDIDTVKEHLAALSKTSKIASNVYSALGAQATEMTRQRNKISDQQLDNLQKLLAE